MLALKPVWALTIYSSHTPPLEPSFRDSGGMAPPGAHSWDAQSLLSGLGFKAWI